MRVIGPGRLVGPRRAAAARRAAGAPARSRAGLAPERGSLEEGQSGRAPVWPAFQPTRSLSQPHGSRGRLCWRPAAFLRSTL